jgi:hypothetical protein
MKTKLTEVNITNFKDLTTAIDNALDSKKIPRFAGSEVNKVRNWFLKKYIQAIKDDEVDLKNSLVLHKYKEGEPDWMNKADIFDFKGSFPNNVTDEIFHIVDYFDALDPHELKKIDKEPYRIVKQKVDIWDKELALNTSDADKEDKNKKKLVLNKDYKVIKPEGQFKWVKLLTRESKDIEGEFMGHCVGTQGYENADIYSLWDNKNRSHVTIETDDSKKTIKQIKGKGNKRPVEKYLPACIEFVANAMIRGYKIVRDGENINMVFYNDEYYFDDLSILPEKYRDKSIFRKWVDIIYPTEIYPKQQKAFAAILARIVEV